MKNILNPKKTNSENDRHLKYTIWGFILVAIFIVSMVISLSVGIQFEQQAFTFIASLSFVSCVLFLWIIYRYFFQYLPLSFLDIIQRKRKKVVENESIEPIVEKPIIDEEKTEEYKTEEQATEPTQSVSTQQAPQPLTIPTFTQVNYDTQRQAFLKEQEEKREAIIACIIDYTQTMMSQIMRPTEVENLCKEVIAWAADAEYTPSPVRTLPEANKLDAKHYVWNIAARLGGEHATVNNRSRFIQHLFAEMFRDNDFSSMKNLKVKPEEGTIKINEPVKGSYEFTTMKKIEVA